jgi:hypothetical protein
MAQTFAIIFAFEMARGAFMDAFSFERVDTRHGDHEQRFALIGMVDNYLLFVCYTLRGGENAHCLSTESRPSSTTPIPQRNLGTLRDWEDGKAEPDQTERAYLRVIAGDVSTVQHALMAGPQTG